MTTIKLRNWSYHLWFQKPVKVSVDSIHIRQTVILSSTLSERSRIFLDKNLLTNHTRSIARSCFFHLHCVGKLHQYLNRKTANVTAASLILSSCGTYQRTSYCNYSESRTLLQELSLKLRGQITITPILCALHWLPVEKHTGYQILSLVDSCMNGTAPQCLWN